MTTIALAVLCIATLAFATAIAAIFFAAATDHADYDGMEFEEPKKQHPVWRDEL